MKVNMPVEAMGEYCLTCPELDIDILTKENYKLETVEDGITKIRVAIYENTLRCKHCDRCRVIFEHEKQHSNDIPKSAPKTKKTTSKKTVTKK